MGDWTIMDVSDHVPVPLALCSDTSVLILASAWRR